MHALKTAGAGAVLVGALLGAAGCRSAGTTAHPAISSAGSQLAGIPGAQGDATQASALLKSCEQGNHTIAAIKVCLEGKVPAPARKALAQCLGTAYAADLKAASGAPKVRAQAAYATFLASNTAGTGAQPCIATALQS